MTTHHLQEDGTPLDPDIIRSYGLVTREFLDITKRTHAGQVYKQDLKNWISTLRERLEHGTVCNIYILIACFLKFCGVDHKTLLPQNDRPTPVEQTPEAYTQEEITLFFFNIVNERDALAFEFLLLYPERGMCGTVNFLAEKTVGHTVWLENYSHGRIWGEGCASSSLFNFLARISAATSSVLPNTTL